MGKYQKNIEAARQISVVQYLETYRPGELVRKTDREYCTRSHDSLIITIGNRYTIQFLCRSQSRTHPHGSQTKATWYLYSSAKTTRRIAPRFTGSTYYQNSTAIRLNCPPIAEIFSK